MNSNLLILMSLMAAAAGCGGAKIPRVEVIGEVTLDGEPVGAAQVYLTVKSSVPADKHLPATFSAAVVDGSFLFARRNGPPPGKYELVVQPTEPDADEALEQLLKQQGTLIRERNKFLAAASRKGPIRVELSADDVNEVMIELSSR